MNCSPPGFSVPGVFQARILVWVAISFSRGSSPPRDWTQVSCSAGRLFTIWAARELDPKMIPVRNPQVVRVEGWIGVSPEGSASPWKLTTPWWWACWGPEVAPRRCPWLGSRVEHTVSNLVLSFHFISKKWVLIVYEWITEPKSPFASSSSMSLYSILPLPAALVLMVPFKTFLDALPVI